MDYPTSDIPKRGKGSQESTFVARTLTTQETTHAVDSFSNLWHYGLPGMLQFSSSMDCQIIFEKIHQALSKKG